jgi:ribonuclease P/MRP protein subunit RPP1
MLFAKSERLDHTSTNGSHHSCTEPITRAYMFYDLNLPVSAPPGSALAAQEQLETRKRVELLVHCMYPLNPPSTNPVRETCVDPKKTYRSPVQFKWNSVLAVGYQAVAYNHEVTGKISNNHVRIL